MKQPDQTRPERQGKPKSPDTDSQRMRKRSVTIAGHRTSVSLEDAFWVMLPRIAAARRKSVGALITEIDRTRTGNLSSAIRVFVLAEIAARADTARPTG